MTVTVKHPEWFNADCPPYSTVASRTCSSRTSSPTPTTLGSRSSPSSPTGEEEEEEDDGGVGLRFVDNSFCFLSLSVVRAGTELTWDYSADTQRKQEVACFCGSNSCEGHFTIEENLCDVCEG